MPKRITILLYFLVLMALVIAPAACGDSNRNGTPASSPSTSSPSVVGQTASPTSSPTATPAPATPSSTPSATPTGTPTPPPSAATTPAALGPGNVNLNASWFSSRNSGWLAGQGCVQMKPGTSNGQPSVMRCTGIIYHTIDGGKHWLSLETGELVPCKIQFTSDKTGWLIGVKNGDCFGSMRGTGVIQQTSDGGSSWTTRYLTSHPGTLPVDLRFTSNDQGWVTLSACPSEEGPCTWQVVSTTNSGRSWNTATIPITAHEASMSHPDAADGWVIAGGNGLVNIVDSHDGGRTWQIRLIPVTQAGWRATIFFRNAQQGWFLTGGSPGAGNEYKDLFGTTDAGKTWKLIAGENTKTQAPGPLGSAGYVGPLVFTSPNDGWVTLARGGLIRTTNGGKHWSPVKAIPVEPSPYNIEFGDSQLGWATSGRYVMLTSNGGATWKTVPLPPSFPPEPGIPPNYNPPG